MSILVDTGVLYADHDTSASIHDAVRVALEAVYDGEFGQPYVSDYIFDEAVTLTRSRGTSFQPAKQLSDRIRGLDRTHRSTSSCGSQRPSFRMQSMCSNSMTISN